MSDTRELILSRILLLAKGIVGDTAAGRNVTDNRSLTRPSILLHDGSEEFLDKPSSEYQGLISRIVLTQPVVILAAASAPDVGSLLNSLRARLLVAIMNDSQINTILGTNGSKYYAGCVVDPVTAENREGRMELSIIFTYVFRISDLSA